MSILVVGSVALDHLETPFGVRERALGGSATFISIAARYLAPDVRFVGIVGGDFPQEHIDDLEARGIDLAGLERVPEGKTFSWGGRYHDDMNQRDTLYTELGVFAQFNPAIPEAWRRSDIVVLGNIHPSLQSHVLDQIAPGALVICDTMNLWIDTTRDDLLATIRRVDVLVLNDQEARQLTGERGTIAAARRLLAMGPRRVVVKKGEHGAFLMSADADNAYAANPDAMFFVPAYPLEAIKDPTGAGDTFAGGFAGALAASAAIDEDAFRRAMVYGSALASFCVEEFGIEGIRALRPDGIAARVERFREMVRFTA
jgi:sugar/nucleoside kinase (ribokinase family)